MHCKRRESVLVSITIAALCAGCSAEDESVTRRGELLSTLQSDASARFHAPLSGDEEVPPVDTNARGQAHIEADDTELSFKVVVANIDDAIMAHIHCAPEGVNGPIGVTLYNGDPVSKSGILVEGVVTAPDVNNGCGWMDIADVVEAMAAGDAYVNVHTEAHRSGEIRGQLR